MDVQIFGVKNDADTRKAIRFFKERRINVHFVDFKVRGPSKGELRRFVQKFGADALIDRSAKRFKDLGLHTVHYGTERWLEIASEEPLILRVPLVRSQSRLTVGLAEGVWREWTATPLRP
jgi:arsenate reductase